MGRTSAVTAAQYLHSQELQLLAPKNHKVCLWVIHGNISPLRVVFPCHQEWQGSTLICRITQAKHKAATIQQAVQSQTKDLSYPITTSLHGWRQQRAHKAVISHLKFKSVALFSFPAQMKSAKAEFTISRRFKIGKTNATHKANSNTSLGQVTI